MSDDDNEREEYVYVLDFLPQGRAEDRTHHEPIVQGVGEKNFTLLELVARGDAQINIGERIYVGSGKRDKVERVKRRLSYDELTSSSKAELEYAVKAIIEDNEDRFIDFFNDAQSVTIRLHQLDLLPGIGKKLRNGILDERKIEPFDSFEDLEDRVSGLHNPKDILSERIVNEIQDEDLKYRIFAR
ncbi:MAG: DUF655 domain-containing protein [Halobacteria archaeon]|nr:DUF655 domain-containing protein [Halobacteria archaeon]